MFASSEQQIQKVSWYIFTWAELKKLQRKGLHAAYGESSGWKEGDAGKPWEKKKKNIIEINRVISLIPFLTYDTERCSSAAVLAVGLACLCFDRTDEEVQLC